MPELNINNIVAAVCATGRAFTTYLAIGYTQSGNYLAAGALATASFGLARAANSVYIPTNPNQNFVDNIARNANAIYHVNH